MEVKVTPPHLLSSESEIKHLIKNERGGGSMEKNWLEAAFSEVK